MQTQRDELLEPGTKETEVRAHLAKVTEGKSESSATSDFGLAARNHYVATSGWLQPALMEKESPPPTFIEDASLQASLRQIVAGFTGNPVLQEELMQESLVHLWGIERDKPGRTR